MLLSYLNSLYRNLFRKTRIERDLDDEIHSYLELLTDQKVKEGMNQQEAVRAASIELGGTENLKANVRAIRAGAWLETLFQDLRFAIRTFRRSPGFVLTAVTALALGIGANVAIFSVVNTVFLKPLHAPDADRIVQVLPIYQGVAYSGASGLPVFNLWKQQTSIFREVSAYRLDRVNLTGGSSAELIPVARASADFFHLFGAMALQGRTFTADEDRPHGGNVAVLSYGFWTRRFGRDPQVLGKGITLGNINYVVIGILSPDFDTEQFDLTPDVWVPFQIEPDTTDHGSYCYVAARLNPGVTISMATAQVQSIFQQYRHEILGDVPKDSNIIVQPLRVAMGNSSRPLIMLLVGAVSFVLLIACANVANLLLVRGTGRLHEIAVRVAVGAGPVRIIRQLITESTMLSLAGGIAGLGLGMIGIRVLLALYPGNLPLTSPTNPLHIPRIGESGSAITLDWRVLGFTVIASLVTAVLFGVLPAVQTSRVDLNILLKENSGRSGGGFRQHRIRSLLVVVEMVLAVMMLIGSALFIRSYVALRSVDPGFDSANILTMQMSLTNTQFEKTAEMDRLARDGIRRTEALPGVSAAAVTCCLPLETVWQLQVIVVGRPLNGPYHRFGGWTFISPRYFDVFKIPVLRGRVFSDSDNAGAPNVVIINQAMANALWPNSDPLNDQLIIGRGMRPEYAKDTPRQIVGIVGDVRDTFLNQRPRPAMYVPIAQLPDGINIVNLRLLPITWIVRTGVEPHSLGPAIQNELLQASGGLPVSGIRSMDEVEAQATARLRFEMLLMTIFGCLALLLASIGIYGLIAYSVQQRAHEIGIRLALGAEPGDVRKMVVFQGMRLAAAGVAVGVLAAFGLTRFLARFLFGIKPWDPMVFVAVPIILIFVAFVAVWLPARRATRMDLMDVLRYE